MISLIKFKVKTFDIKTLKKVKNPLEYLQKHMPTLNDLHECKCPKCGAINRFSHYCYYVRNLSFVFDDSVHNFKVTVERVICNSCKSTHALLPAFIVPYKIMAFQSICNIVKEASATSAYALSQKIGISFELIYQYITLFMSFFPNVNILNNANNYTPKFSEEKFVSARFMHLINISFQADYFSAFKWIFLMSKFRNSTYNSVYIGMA